MGQEFQQEKKLSTVFLVFFLSAILMPIAFLMRVGLDSFVQKRSLWQREAFDRHADLGRELDQTYVNYANLLRDIGTDFLTERALNDLAGVQQPQLWFDKRREFFKSATKSDSQLGQMKAESIIRQRYLKQFLLLRDKVWSFFTDEIDGFGQGNCPLRVQIWAFERSMYSRNNSSPQSAISDSNDFYIHYGRIFNNDFTYKPVEGEDEGEVHRRLSIYIKNKKQLTWSQELPSHPIFFDNSDFLLLLWDMFHGQLYRIMKSAVFGVDITQPCLYTINGFFQMEMFSHRSTYFVADLLNLIVIEGLWEFLPLSFDYDLYRFGLPEKKPLEMPKALAVALLDLGLLERFFLDGFTDAGKWNKKRYNALFQYQELLPDEPEFQLLCQQLWYNTQLNLSLRLLSERVRQSMLKADERSPLVDRLLHLFDEEELQPFSANLETFQQERRAWRQFYPKAEKLMDLFAQLNQKLLDWRSLFQEKNFFSLKQELVELRQICNEWLVLPNVREYSDLQLIKLDELLESWEGFVQKNQQALSQLSLDANLENKISGTMNRITKSKDDVWVYLRKGELVFWYLQLKELKSTMTEDLVHLELLDNNKILAEQGSMTADPSFSRPLFTPTGSLGQASSSHFITENNNYRPIQELKKTLNAKTGEYSIEPQHLRDFLAAELDLPAQELSLTVNNLIPLMQKQKRAVHFTYEHQGTGFLGTIYPSARLGGKCFFFYQSEERLLASIIKQRNLIFFLALFAVIAALLLGRNLSHLVVLPIIGLKEAVEKFGRQEVGRKLTYNRFKGNEIDELKYYFGRMADNVKDKLFRMEMVRKLHEALNLPSYICVILNDLKNSYPEALSNEELTTDPQMLSVRVIRKILLHYLITSLCCRYQAKYGIIGFFEQGLSNTITDYSVFNISNYTADVQEKVLTTLVRQLFPMEEENFGTSDGEVMRCFNATELAEVGLDGENAVLFASRHFMKDYAININGVLLMIDIGGSTDKEEEKIENLSRTVDSVADLCAQAGTVIVKTYLEEIDTDAKKGWEIQESLMPSGEPDTNGCLEIESVYIPSPQRLAGDYYDFLRFPDSGFFGCTIADVSGKGIGASLFGSSSRAFMKVIPEIPSDTAFAITTLNKKLCDISDIIKNETTQGLFLTMFYLVIDLHNLIMYYSSGGHNQMFLQRADGCIEELAAKGLPIGMFSLGRYEAKSVQLQLGDSIILYTDGVTEMEAPNQELYGDERFKNFCLENSKLSCSDWAIRLNEALTAHRRGILPTDDVTFIRIKIKRQYGEVNESIE